MNLMDITVRQERPEDIPDIRRITIEAFGSKTEADLIEALRKSNVDLISLVADNDGEIVGHAHIVQPGIPGG